MCGDDSDSGKLWALDDQLMRLVSDARGGPLQGLRILLMHHPSTSSRMGPNAGRCWPDEWTWCCAVICTKKRWGPGAILAIRCGNSRPAPL